MKQMLMKMTTKISTVAGRNLLKLEKKSPEILLFTGIVGIVGTVVLASRETLLHADEILAEREKEMEKIKEAEQIDPDYKSSHQELADKAVVNVKMAGRFARIYTPSIALGCVSLACIIKSNGILKTRYLNAVSAFNALQDAFKTYRERVVAEEGADADRHYRYGSIKEEITEEVEDENGKKKKKKVMTENIEPGKPSIYAKYFDQVTESGIRNPNWFENPAHSMTFLRAQESIANDILQTKGHLFLNQVYDMLGLEDTQEGALVGWVKGCGDDFVSFGLDNYEDPSVRRFVNGKDNAILLDFNVDGIIYDKI